MSGHGSRSLKPRAALLASLVAVLGLLALVTARTNRPASITVALARGQTPPAPLFVLPRLDAEGTLDLASLRGKVVVVNFWATWCDPCKDEMPSLERLKAKLAGRPFEVLAVNYGEFPPKIAQYLEKEKITLPVLLDTQKDAAKEWKVGGLPMTFIVDARGRVRYWVFGERDWSAGGSLELVEELLAEAPRARH
jgi:thiol-disulfide isomerase/thioredoxin